MPTREERLAYNREYYRQNKHRWARRTPEKQAEYNANRRRRYKEDPEFRARVIEQSVSSRKKNPKQRIYSKYGITADEYERLIDAGCGICGGTFELGAKPHVDHDHATGKTRGILCQSCNLAIGHMRDDPMTAYKAMQYLLSGGTLHVET